MLRHKIARAMENAADNLLMRREPHAPWKRVVVGIGMGSKHRRRHDDDLLLRVYLAHPEIPGPLSDYLNCLEVPYALRVTGKFRLLFGPGDEITSGPTDGAQGTLGAIVEDIDPATSPAPQYILSCEHVLGAKRNKVYQTNSAHHGIPPKIATVTNLIPLGLSVSADAAIARIESNARYTSSFPIPLASTYPVDPAIGANVSHWGAASSRDGSIEDIHVSLMIDVNAAIPTFNNLALIDGDFAQPGDSGSVVIDTDQMQAAAMVFAKASFQGEPTAVAAYSLQVALDTFGVRLVAPTTQTLLELDGVAGVSVDKGGLRILLKDDSEATRKEVGYALDLLGFQGAVDYSVTGEFHLL